MSTCKILIFLLLCLTLLSATAMAAPSEEKCLSLSCVGEDHLEAEEAKRRAGNPCWGFLATHTYRLPYRMKISKISAKVTIGPLDAPGREGRLFVEVSLDGEQWKIVKSFHVKSGEEYEFEIELDKPRDAEYIRFRVNPPPYAGEWLSVDFSSVTICEFVERRGMCSVALFPTVPIVLAVLLKFRI